MIDNAVWRSRYAGALVNALAAATLGLGAVACAPAGATGITSTPSILDYSHAGSDDSGWILPAKNYANERYVNLNAITPSNVAQLKPVWTFKVSDNGPIEAPPIIWHGIAYISSAHDHVYAIDVKTGALKWEFSDNPHVISFAANRGVALLDGNVYLGTLDGRLIALNAETGKVVFDVVDVADTRNAFFSMAPLPYRNPRTGKTMLLMGASNGDWGGIGNISAFDPKDGHRLWQWNTVPGPGQRGHSTWGNSSWKRGGAAVWAMMALDPKTGMLYANTGNPQPDFNGSSHPGTNLYSDSLLALNILGDKPKLVWYHQFTPHDTHDWDPAMPPVLFHAKVGGKVMPLVADGDKAGNFWLLNSRTGRLVNHVAVTFQYNQHSEPSRQGTVACPKHGIEFNGGSFDPKTDMFYVPSNSQCGLWKSTKSATYIPGQFYLGGFFPQLIGAAWGDLSAIDLDSGVFAWRHHDNLPMAGGVVSTASGLVFTGELDGDFDAFDATTGKELWKYQTGSPIIAPPVVFTTDGREYVAVASGPAGTEQLPILPKPDGTKLTMFAISR